MTYIAKISKPDFDVKTAAIKDLSMTSEAKSLKIHDEGTWSQAVVALGGPYTIPIDHSLGYVPSFRVYGTHDPADGIIFQYPCAIGTANITSVCYADTSKIYIKLFSGGATTTGNITGYYYIFKDEQ